jgi:hypothetical protein
MGYEQAVPFRFAMIYQHALRVDDQCCVMLCFHQEVREILI